MNFTVTKSNEQQEENVVRLIVEIATEEVIKACDHVYQRKRKDFNVPGYRQGKASKALIEKIYGKDVFLADAVNNLVNDSAYLIKEENKEILHLDNFEVVAAGANRSLVYEMDAVIISNITLGQYKGLHHHLDLTVNDEDVDDYIENLRRKNDKKVVVDREVMMGDEISLNFEGFVDGVAFEGGKSENYPLKIGSGSFIPGFEEQMVGKKANEQFSIDVTFPNDYHEKSLAGKPATFKCYINEIKESVLPELDDEFAKEVGYGSLVELKASAKKIVTEDKIKYENDKMQNDLLSKVCANSKVHIPNVLIEKEIDNLIDSFEKQLSYQGLNLEMYFKFTGLTMEQLRKNSKGQAENSLKLSFVLEEIAKQEKFEITEEDIEEEYKRIAGTYGMEVVDIKKAVDKESIILQINRDKAIKLIVDSAVLD